MKVSQEVTNLFSPRTGNQTLDSPPLTIAAMQYIQFHLYILKS